MRRKSEKDQALADNAKLLRTWRRWHREQLEEALAGVHCDVLERLMAQLKDLRSARELVDFIAAQDWAAVDADTRFTALHQINAAITTLRETNALPPFNDAIPWTDERPTAFQIIRGILTPVSANAERHAEADLGKQETLNE
jgi:hypothetical protein